MGKSPTYALIKAGSVLGLKPTGVECAPDVLLEMGLAQLAPQDIRTVQDYNHHYSSIRDRYGMMNAVPLRDFSLELGSMVSGALDEAKWPVVLGGDCSIVVGIMAALRQRGRFGIITFDAHADFYLPAQSVSGEAADMDIALITGRGDERLYNIYHSGPYVRDEDVVHIGQRDQQEADDYGSARLQDTDAQLMSLEDVRSMGIEVAEQKLRAIIKAGMADGYWLHVDTDVLHDEDNPAVDYRLADGLRFVELERLLAEAIASRRIVGMSVAIYNPRRDAGGVVGRKLVAMLQRCLSD